MIRLNLLPPSQKKEICLEQIRHWVSFYAFATGAILGVFILILVAIYILVSAESASTESSYRKFQTGNEGQGLSSYKKLAEELNSEVEKISQIQENHKYYSLMIVSLSEIMPAGVRLESLSIDEKNQVILTGFADSREKIMEFKQALENSGKFENIESPLANLVKQSNIDFDFKFNFKPEILKR